MPLPKTHVRQLRALSRLSSVARKAASQRSDCMGSGGRVLPRCLESMSDHATTKFPNLNTQLRSALPTDALCLSALATQVFFDTYATSGINADLANEAQKLCSQAAFSARLGNPNVEISVAEADGNLVGFVDLQLHSPCPVPSVAGPEVLRLYVQAPFQRLGIGRALLAHAEARASYLGEPSVWLTAWVGNAQALAFYPQVGYAEVGTTQYVIHRLAYENRIFAKALRMGGV
jgi:ribosomal protein S18 acetylase RimI-like enzyme